jgi:Helix-turn-helix domain
MRAGVAPEFLRVQREGAELQARGTPSASHGDDSERFLADLRALRDQAALEHDELAARAHFPRSILLEAENGPRLPALPILAAYVRACDGDVLEWEERWRRLGYAAQADPCLPVRPAGASQAAVAGARAATSIAPPDVCDPDRIRTALRTSAAPADAQWSGPEPSLAEEPPAQPQTRAEPAVPPTAAAQGRPRPDRFRPLQLLLVVVIAALIGSILVLLLR